MTNRRFSTDLENSDHSEFSKTLFDPGEFLTHIMLVVIFPCIIRLFCVLRKYAYLHHSQFILVVHEL
jgi:hypothetical protein